MSSAPTQQNYQTHLESISTYEKMKSNPVSFVHLHLLVMENAQEAGLRKFAAVIMNKSVFREEKYYTSLTFELRNQLNKKILQLANNEKSDEVIKVYNTIIVNIFTALQQLKEPWSDIYEAAFEWIKNGDDIHRNCGFDLLSDLIIYTSAEELRKYYDSILFIIDLCLKNDNKFCSNTVTSS